MIYCFTVIRNFGNFFLFLMPIFWISGPVCSQINLQWNEKLLMHAWYFHSFSSGWGCLTTNAEHDVRGKKNLSQLNEQRKSIHPILFPPLSHLILTSFNKISVFALDTRFRNLRTLTHYFYLVFSQAASVKCSNNQFSQIIKRISDCLSWEKKKH